MHLLDALNALRNVDDSIISSQVMVEFETVTTDRDKATRWSVKHVSDDVYGEWLQLLDVDDRPRVSRYSNSFGPDKLWTVNMMR